MDYLTHAVTIPQPLAWVCAAGHCPIIPSDTRPPLEHEGKLLGIHAGQRWMEPGKPAPLAFGVMANAGSTEDALHRGALIGVARLVGVVRLAYHAHAGQPVPTQFEVMVGRSVARPYPQSKADLLRPWWPPGTKWGLLLSEAVLIPEPIPMRGAGGVWELLVPGDPGVETWAPDFAEWALEQWRKARSS